MIYLHDIVLNFQNNYYQFFEWNQKDNIINVKKIPLYRVSDKNLLYLKENEITVKEEIINRIKNDNKRGRRIICIISNGKTAIAILFNNKGELIKKSSLIFEEEEEALSLVKNLKETKIFYKKNIKHKQNNLLRIEKEKKEEIISYIKNNRNNLTLKYLYYECYEKEINGINILKNTLLNELSKDWNEKQKKIYDTINLLMESKKIS